MEPGQLPEMPVDFPAYATSGMATVGTIIGEVAGIIIIHALIYLGYKWMQNALSSGRGWD